MEGMRRGKEERERERKRERERERYVERERGEGRKREDGKEVRERGEGGIEGRKLGGSVSGMAEIYYHAVTGPVPLTCNIILSISYLHILISYLIAPNFRGAQFLWIGVKCCGNNFHGSRIPLASIRYSKILWSLIFEV